MFLIMSVLVPNRYHCHTYAHSTKSCAMFVHLVQPLSLQSLAHHIELERLHLEDIGPLHAFLHRTEIDAAEILVFRTVDRHGAIHWFELRAQLLTQQAETEANQSIGVLIDMTQRRRLAEHAALQQKFFEVLAQSPDRSTLIAAMLDTVLGLSDLDGGGLYWERGDGGYDLLVSRGLSDAFLNAAGSIEPSDPRVGIIRSGAMVCSCADPQDGCTDSGLVHQASLQAEGIVALVVLPITVAGRGSACLNLASRHVRRLPASSISLLQSLAEQFGLAIERLVAREDAQNHRQNLQGFFHALQDFVFVLNDLGEIQYVNPAVHAKLGYDDKLLGKSILAVHPERVHASAWMIVTDMLQGKRTSCPLPILRADGSELMVDTRIVHGRWNGKPALLGVSRDISEQRALEQALQQQRDTLRTLINTIPELVWLKDVNGYYLACNPAFEALFGHTEADITGKTDFDFVDADLARYFRANDLAAIEAGHVTSNEEWLTFASDGHRALMSTCKTPMYSTDGTLQGVLGISHDITQRVAAEQALQSSLHEKEALLKEVHHRVKNNLQIISSLIRLEAGRTRQEEVKSVLGDMQGRIRSMALLHELLYRSPSLAEIDMGQYIRQLAMQVFSANVSKRAPVDLKIDITPVAANLDQAIPCGLLVNELITNALKHGFPESHSGSISVELHPVGESSLWSLSVSDSGIGLPEDFESKRQGSLGLQLASGLANQLGGALSVGPGTKFSVRFSIVEHAPAAVAA